MTEGSKNTVRRGIVIVATVAVVIILARLLLATTDLPNQELIKEVLWVLGAVIISFVGGMSAVEAFRKRRC